MLEGAKVKEYFDAHPEAAKVIENTEAQFVCWRPELTHDDMYRLLTVDDIKYITFGGWFGESGVFAWYYPGGVPHYVQIAESAN